MCLYAHPEQYCFETFLFFLVLPYYVVNVLHLIMMCSLQAGPMILPYGSCRWDLALLWSPNAVNRIMDLAPKSYKHLQYVLNFSNTCSLTSVSGPIHVSTVQHVCKLRPYAVISSLWELRFFSYMPLYINEPAWQSNVDSIMVIILFLIFSHLDI